MLQNVLQNNPFVLISLQTLFYQIVYVRHFTAIIIVITITMYIVIAIRTCAAIRVVVSIIFIKVDIGIYDIIIIGEWDITIDHIVQ